MTLTNKDVRRFLLINTVEYNGDGRYIVSDVAFDGLEEYGVDDEEKCEADRMRVGDIQRFDIGFYVMRVA